MSPDPLHSQSVSGSFRRGFPRQEHAAERADGVHEPVGCHRGWLQLGLPRGEMEMCRRSRSACAAASAAIRLESPQEHSQMGSGVGCCSSPQCMPGSSRDAEGQHSKGGCAQEGHPQHETERGTPARKSLQIIDIKGRLGTKCNCIKKCLPRIPVMTLPAYSLLPSSPKVAHRDFGQPPTPHLQAGSSPTLHTVGGDPVSTRLQ